MFKHVQISAIFVLNHVQILYNFLQGFVFITTLKISGHWVVFLGWKPDLKFLVHLC